MKFTEVFLDLCLGLGTHTWNGLSWDWRSGAGPAVWGGDWAWEKGFEGGVSTRESIMKGNTLLTHHTHLQRPKGEESTQETQNSNCKQGEPLGAGPG